MLRLIRLLSLFGVLVATAIGCGPSTRKDHQRDRPAEAAMQAGFQVLETSCFSCHSPDAEAAAGIAPTLAAIKAAYGGKATSPGQFRDDLAAFLQSPSTETSRMPDAIAQYGLMPKMSLSDAEVAAVAAYLFYTPLEIKDWYARHFAAEQSRYRPQAEELPQLEQGLKLAMQTKAILGSNLLKAIQAGGPEHAVDFCSTRAIALTDSMGRELHAGIKRVSDRNRNPANAVNADELAYIQAARARMEQGEKPLPQLQQHGDSAVGYYPIVMDALCLQCHGSRETDISPSTWSVLQARYPDDRAYGFALGELRGIWVVEMAQ
jgi:mono/diheme cytochrome c family protein